MYKLPSNGFDGILAADGRWIPNDDSNRDWVDYQAWLQEGNTPAAAEPVAETPVREISKEDLLMEVDALRAKIEAQA